MADIRELGDGDHRELFGLCERVSSGFAPVGAGPEGAQAFLSDPASFALGAYAQDMPVGLAWGIQMRSPSGRLTSYLHELEVTESWRGRGIGRALVLRAMEIGHRRGSTKFWLSTDGQNRIAQSLYHSLGGDRKAKGNVNYWWDLP